LPRIRKWRIRAVLPPVDKRKQSDHLEETQRKRRWGCFLTLLLTLAALIVLFFLVSLYFLREIPAPALDEYLVPNANGVIRLHIQKDNRPLHALSEQFFEAFLRTEPTQGKNLNLNRIFGALNFLFHRDLYVVLVPGDETQHDRFTAIVAFRRLGKVVRFFLRQPFNDLISASEQVGTAGGFTIFRNLRTSLFFAITNREILISDDQSFIETLASRKTKTEETQSSARLKSYAANLPSRRSTDEKSVGLHQNALIAGFILNENHTFSRFVDPLESLLPEAPIDFQRIHEIDLAPTALEALSFRADLLTADELALELTLHCPSPETRADVARAFEKDVLPALHDALEDVLPITSRAEQREGIFRVTITARGIQGLVKEAGQELSHQRSGSRGRE
jgi:hypothetical protein